VRKLPPKLSTSNAHSAPSAKVSDNATQRVAKPPEEPQAHCSPSPQSAGLVISQFDAKSLAQMNSL
jgi:hypothetical protein